MRTIYLFIFLIIQTIGITAQQIPTKTSEKNSEQFQQKREWVDGVEMISDTFYPYPQGTGEVWKALLGNYGKNIGNPKCGKDGLGAIARGWAVFDIYDIPTNATIQSAIIWANCNDASSDATHRIYVKEINIINPITQSASEVYNGFTSVNYSSSWNAMTTTGWTSVNLNSNGINALQNEISGADFIVGFMEVGENADPGTFRGYSYNEPYMIVTYTVPPQCDLSMFYPNGGETFTAGNNLDIWWDGTIPSSVKLELYKGGSFNRTIVSSTSNDGYHSWTIPSDISSGNDYKIKVTDVNNSSCYDYSNNNFTINAALPDLIVNSYSSNPAQVYPGETINVSCQIKNIGSGSAGSSRVGYYISSNCGSSLTFLDYDGVSSLDPNGTSNESETLTIPSNTSPGFYYVTFIADYQNSVTESNENNNTSCGDAFFEVRNPPPTITVSPSSLDFGNVNVGSNSSVQSYQLSGSNLTSSITVQSPNGFEISSNGSNGWGSYLNYNNSGGSVSANVYVRFSPEIVQTYSGNITNTSSGATEQKVSVSGTGLDIAPNAPGNLFAQANSSTQINLQWTDNSNNETGFKIERKTAAGQYEQIGMTGMNSTTYSDQGLMPNTTYYYRVAAYNSIGNSNYSNETNATTPDIAPAAPGNLTANSVNSTQINLQWTDNSNNETGFKIERKTATSQWAQIGMTGMNSTTYSDQGLTPNTTYYYRVAAYNSIGNSNYSNEANAKTPEVVPLSPANFNAEALQSPLRIYLTWSDLANNELGFKLQKSMDGQPWQDLITLPVNTTNYSDAIAFSGTYTYQICAYNSAGNSGYVTSSPQTVTSLKGIEFQGGIPEQFTLFQNYPNPFNPATKIQFGLEEESVVSLRIFSIMGEQINVPLFGEVLGSGFYSLNIDLGQFSSGVYLYLLTAESTMSSKKFKETKKMILSK